MLRLSVTKHRASNHAAAPWLVVVPRRLSATGKRQFHYFTTKGAAGAFARALRESVRCCGEGAQVLAARESADAQAARALLEGSGLTLVQAALLALELLQHSQPPAPAVRKEVYAAAQVQAGAEMAVMGKEAPPLLRRTRRRHTLASVFKEMQEAKLHQSPHTQRSRAGRFRTLFRRNPGLEQVPLAVLSARDVQLALDRAWPQAPTSWNAMLAHLGALFHYALRKGYVGSHPLGAIDRKYVREREIMPLTPGTLRELLLACRPPTPEERAGGKAAGGTRAAGKGLSAGGARAAGGVPAAGTGAAAGGGKESREGKAAGEGTTAGKGLEPGGGRAPGVEGSRSAGRELALDTTALRPYIAIAAFAGLRPTEAARLRWGDINVEEGCISVRRRASKTGGTRHVEMHPTLRAWLEPLRPQEHPPGEAVFGEASRLVRGLRAVHRRAGFDEGHPWPEDALRHSYASYYLKAGGALERLQLNMGHASTALIYGRYCNMYGLTRQMAAEWWGLTPEVVLGVTPPHTPLP